MAHSRIFWGCSSPGHQAFLDRHEEIFKGRLRGTALRQDVVSLRFVGPEAAVVEALTWVLGLSASGPPPTASWDVKGRLRTWLLQVMVKEAVIGRSPSITMWM